MKKAIIAAISVIVIVIIFCFVFPRISTDNTNSGVRVYQHEENKDADSTVGKVEIASDGVIDPNTFETHLPLVVLDMNGQTPPNIYKNINNGKDRVYADPNVTNPWIDMSLTLIDNDSKLNKPLDAAAFQNNGKIKLRGASSRQFKKQQYGIKLLDENGEELEESLLGMGADEDWVLSNSILDATLIRNYMAYNIGGQIFPFTPEARFCEVIIKDGDIYTYQGLYLLTETIKQSEDRVDIQDFDPYANRLSFIICRDRYNHTSTTLSTWASDEQICYGWFTFKYPREVDLTEEVVDKIETELSVIEKVIYSDDPEVFKTYSNYIDVDSFVDYFVVNEFFMNYDAGNNSTYYYQDSANKLTMGPLWDYDNCWDNYKLSVGDAEYIVFSMRPWFEKLVRDPDFVDRVSKRYHELRETIFSDEYIEEFVDSTVDYLGNAALRDRSRWRETYEREHMLWVETEGQGFTIDRNRDTYEEEIIRLLDMQQLHGAWLDEYIEAFLSETIWEDLQNDKMLVYDAIAVGFVLVFVAIVVLVRRKSQE